MEATKGEKLDLSQKKVEIGNPSCKINIEGTNTSYTSESTATSNVVLQANVNSGTTASGYKYQWYKDNVAISGATGSSYIARSDGIISLMATSNLVDPKAVTYTWYKNNQKINNSNVKDYIITSNYEDADYYVEITTPTGDVYKSDPVNVKINREV